ncbi:hypothetical protein G9P44_004535 [Scheffersomyces stipitis]|nr:hypothetical protein G9P44_004535 [Scheffersomyces stipitis]
MPALHQVPLRVLSEPSSDVGKSTSPKFASAFEYDSALGGSANRLQNANIINNMNVKMKSGSPLATSFTPSSTSSSTSDLADLKGDLLADLWQTSSRESSTSSTFSVPAPTSTNTINTNYINNNMSVNMNMSVNSVNTMPQYYQNNVGYSGSYAPGTTWNFASSPPLFNQHQPVTVQKEYFQQPNLVPNSNINNSNNNMYIQNEQLHQPQPQQFQQPVLNNSNPGVGLYPALTEENLMFNTEVDPLYMESRKQVYQDQPQEEVFNFEEQQQLQQSVVRPNQRSSVSSFGHNHKSGSSTSDVSSTGSSPEAQSNFAYHSKNQQQVNTQLYKTELCVSFMKMGICPYGNKCQFAHGENELKTVERPPKWRSKPCANWAKLGSCRYGNRCCFKHGD